MFHASTQAFPPRQSRSPPIDDMVAGPEITIMSNGLNGVSKARKMRASCDACSRAKVSTLHFGKVTIFSDTVCRSNATKSDRHATDAAL
ncbi:hypothetical protein IG631_16736 [Alternaria alternata]|nr:hypothetical protein IG631_16736 [Alternaria alternata]